MEKRSESPRNWSRRQLLGTAVVSIAAVSTEGPSLTAQTPPSSQEFDRAARESHRQNSAILAMFEIPMSLEPAFQFRA